MKLSLCLSLLLTVAVSGAETLRINGSTTVNPVAVEAAEALRAQKNMVITVDTQGGSSGGISGVGDGSIQIGMSSKPLSDDDRRKYPRTRFVSTRIGEDAVALVVERDVYDGGVKALSRQQIIGIYEGRITNWKEVGGPDRRIVFFNKEPGRGTWEVFAHYLYGDPNKAPEVSHPEVGANEEARNKVMATPGAVTQLSSAWAEGNPRVKAVAIRLDDGTVAEPTQANIASGRYPMSRALFLVTDGPPAGGAKTFIDFVLSPRGQVLVKKHGYLPLVSAPPSAASKPLPKKTAGTK
jgi:phosphate transport system substrate-binding protein